MFRITSDPIAPRILDEAFERGAGGVVNFFGIVRARADDGREVEGLSYEAYEPMAVAELERIGDEARELYGVGKVAVVHRIGEVAVGEIAIAVATAAPHRAAAFDACRYVVDEVKRRAPIWKKERYAGGDEHWKANDGER